MNEARKIRSRKPVKEPPAFSVCPAGRRYPLPADRDYAREFQRLKRIVDVERRKGREIVVVMGLGFVGAVMAGVIADSADRKTGRPGKFVIGMQRPSTRSAIVSASAARSDSGAVANTCVATGVIAATMPATWVPCPFRSTMSLSIVK